MKPTLTLLTVLLIAPPVTLRAAEPGAVVRAPGSPEGPVQPGDVRDLAPELNSPQPRHIVQTWAGPWITNPDLLGTEPASVLFRRTFDLATKPSSFVINITADNHYTLFVNGTRVCFGPQLSDLRHWRYETVDLAPYLDAGTNSVAVEVVNWGPDRFFGLQSHRTGLLINGFSPAASVVATVPGARTWKTLVNRGLTFRPVAWRSGKPEIIGGFYANNPTDELHAAAYPWGWEQNGFNDSAWKPAVFLENSRAMGGAFGWMTEPRNTPMQTQRRERIARVARTSGLEVPAAFLAGARPLSVPPRTTATVLLDHARVTTGYPELIFSGGQGAEVRLVYAENLFAPDKSKGHRDDIAGKAIAGYQDVIHPDGGARRLFRPSWLRTFRYLQLNITTGDSPLVLEDLTNLFTVSPIARVASFRSDQPVHEKIFDLCWRTVELCTQDYFLSDAYYETMQYVGDTKVHALVWQTLTGDDRHWRNALGQFHDSRLPDGNLTSCYPLRATFVHPTYSLIWIDMLWDHLRLHGDRDFIRPFLPGIRHTLDGIALTCDPDGLPGKTKWDYFVDWFPEAKRGGVAPGSENGSSAVISLHYVFTLRNAASLYESLGMADDAARFRREADRIRQRVVALFHDSATGLFRENATGFRSQHANIMAVLTDAVPPDQQHELLRKTLADPTLSQATYYYRFYLFDALRKARAADLFGPALEPWVKLIDLGLTTAVERFDSPTKLVRSECHPWSTAPAWAYFTVLAGIEPAAVGFAEVNMRPDPGELKFIEGRYPHARGPIDFSLRRAGPTGLQGEVTLPPGLTGTFTWSGRSIRLVPGPQRIDL
ncbi:MAG: hypothetical protein FJ221_09565 [Lentisphaerae bacterium]|nr:hypothetical protein [Lentisphaerota bacterium]